ncbi:hypothetical protein W02_31330 [Nitrospira sp. KM1]|uniref:hypothetical protein n=1 Tax=Nitrospira sp. KM1 TaxID=1936990 RepID=UPI0013A73CD5|nr:hypothetical protein [Nitrospira sp. KM1]BCA55993.1 hypothetical protein W02_31330 [Nitrospira sp. KM1]
MIPATTERVEGNTNEAIIEQIEQDMVRDIASVVQRDEIDIRLKELDEEWDIERALETNAACISLFGLGLGALFDRRLFVIPAVVAGFLLQHAIQGWCPPVPVLRRLGVRTSREIETERYALKVIRGDFEGYLKADETLTEQRIRTILEIVRR